MTFFLPLKYPMPQPVPVPVPGKKIYPPILRHPLLVILMISHLEFFFGHGQGLGHERNISGDFIALRTILYAHP